MAFVYFVQSAGSDGLIKIGLAGGLLYDRLKGLAAMGPTPLRCLGVIRGGEDLEKRLHARFAGSRHHYEWFRPDPEVVEFAQRHARWWPALDGALAQRLPQSPPFAPAAKPPDPDRAYRRRRTADWAELKAAIDALPVV